jgi:hypothetical protein
MKSQPPARLRDIKADSALRGGAGILPSQRAVPHRDIVLAAPVALGPAAHCDPCVCLSVMQPPARIRRSAAVALVAKEVSLKPMDGSSRPTQYLDGRVVKGRGETSRACVSSRECVATTLH